MNDRFVKPIPCLRSWTGTPIRAAVIALALALAVGTSPSEAQQQQLQPSDRQLLQRIVVLVNDQPISVYDINQRLGLVVASVGGVNSEEELNRLRQQVVESMVDERLQLQEAAENEVQIRPVEVDQAFAQIAQGFNQSPQQFENFLNQVGTSKQTLIQQIEAELAWNSLVRGRFGRAAAVGDEQVEDIIERMEENAGDFEYRLSEIFLIVDNPNRGADAKQTADRLIEQIRGGATFANIARQFSSSATAALGGDMGWVSEGQLAPELVRAVSGLEVGEISEPIRTAGGYHIIALRDRRRILSVDPLDAQLDLRQVVYDLTENTETDEINTILDQIEIAAEGSYSCDDLDAYRREVGFDNVMDLGFIRMRDLPPQLQRRVRGLEQGKPAEPYATQQSVNVLFVCGRREPEINRPDFDEILTQLEQQRLSMMARRYLRDLRRDAIVDYR